MGEGGSFLLLSGPLYKVKLLSLAFSCCKWSGGLNARRKIYVFGQLNKTVDCWGRCWGRDGDPLKLLSGAMYKLHLLALVFSYTTRLDRTYATRIIRVFSQLNKAV